MSSPPPAATPAPPSLTELLFAFTKISVMAFGGALPWSRRLVVEERGWMTPGEFNEAFALAQFLPGPNTINFAVVFGSRFAGAPGAFVALAGLVGPPIILMTIAGALYAHYGDTALLSRALGGISAAAAGILLATAVKMAVPLFQNRAVFGPLIAVAAFVAVGIFQVPLPWAVLVLGPISVALAWWRV
jgi:chromate transporter